MRSYRVASVYQHSSPSSTVGHVYSCSCAPAGVIIILSPTLIVLILLGPVSPPARPGAREATHHMFRIQIGSFTENKSPK